MLCGLTSIMFGMYPHGIMYKACEYRCPRPSFYYHYPKIYRIHPDAQCWAYIIVGKET